ncbi:DUF6326 family protein [Dokdonella sp.]|uniref:DUF6326 family protein n=1 Tax=Dokdonella sp. TaxID=2291710 RepID=UPI0025C35DA5|nr:DUF6326 family protein [Dokdonella sp.]MBX3690277.1 hypothetical protein [Dokdonella sp.]
MSELENIAIPTKVKLSVLWTCTVLCYLYCDYFELYVPGKLRDLLNGQVGPFGEVTQANLLGMGIMLIVPCLMVAASIFLRSDLCRWLNILIATAYTALMGLIAVTVTWYFYKIYAVAEIALTLAIVFTAWRWPRQSATTEYSVQARLSTPMRGEGAPSANRPPK